MAQTDNQTAAISDGDVEFIERVGRIYEIAKRCAGEVISQAALLSDDRNTVLRAVIRRLEDAINGK
jgi:hypothetical protein